MLSSVRRFISLAVHPLAELVEGAEGTAGAPLSSNPFDEAAAEVADGQQPKRMSAQTVKPFSLSLTWGGRTRMPS